MLASAGGPSPPGGGGVPTPPDRSDGSRGGEFPVDPDDFRMRFLTQALAEDKNAISFDSPIRPGTPYRVRAPNLLAPDDPQVDVTTVSFMGGLSLEAPLVELRQFRKPTEYAEAAFQEVVETPIANRNPSFGTYFPFAQARFHPLNRVSLGAELAFPPGALDGGGRYVFDIPLVYYWRGELEFANPASVVTYPVP